MELGNQQERQIADLNWLAGIWEGEGWFGFCRNTKVGGIQYTPQSGISNTDPMLMNEVCRILRNFDVPYYLRDIKTPSGLGKKPKQELKITGMLRIKKLLNMLLPVLRTKRDRAECLREFIDRRSSVPPKQKYTELEHALFLKLRHLNGYTLSESSETTRKAA